MSTQTTSINLDNTEPSVMSRKTAIFRSTAHAVCGYSSVNSLLEQVLGPGFILNFPSAELPRPSLSTQQADSLNNFHTYRLQTVF
jgi:hypothetical protein